MGNCTNMTTNNCPPGGPHMFVGDRRCVCGAEEGYAILRHSDVNALRADLAAEIGREDALREALRPFASLCPDDGEDYVDAETAPWITVGWLVVARRALEPQPPDEGKTDA